LITSTTAVARRRRDAGSSDDTNQSDIFVLGEIYGNLEYRRSYS
jgi:hypothetical protein